MRTNHTLLVSALALTVASIGLGCGDAPRSLPGGQLPGGDTGSISLQLTGAGDVAGFQLEVSTPAGVVASRFVTPSPSPFFFTLAPGDYTVTSTPMDGPSTPSTTCDPTSAPATVSKGRTTSLVLVSRCRRPGNGGLDVTIRTDREPEITFIAFNPATSTSPCASIAVDVTASDADGDALSYKFSVTSAPPAPATFTLEVAGNHASFTGSSAGDYVLLVQACDAGGCVGIEVPLHVDGAACTVTCDDGNPCTTDSRGVDGVCAHVTVADGALCSGGLLKVKLLGFNDFHGQLAEGRLVAGRPVGGAAVLASYLRAAQLGIEAQTIIVHAGDHVGASPPDSALLQDEPSISFLNLLANDACSYTDRMNAACNIVGTLGNHEFDEGKTELLRLLSGGTFPTGPFLEDPYRGARFPYVNANVVNEISGETILPPLVVKQVHGVPVAFIGAVLKQTPTVVTPTGVAGLRFLDEADAINAYVPGLKAMGVHAIVVTIHQGGTQTSYTGPTRTAGTTINGADILNIISRLDDDIDVVVSGHAHGFTNAFVPNASGKSILVTQAFSSSTAYGDIDLLVDPVGKDIVSKTAQIVTTFSDVAPGATRDPAVKALADAAAAVVAPLVNEVVGFANGAFTRTENAAGESTLGNLIADAQRAAMGTQLAFMNPGGIRQDLNAGDITWGELFNIQPFGNSLVRMNLTGAQVIAVLEQQWVNQPFARIMKISGFDYTWNPAAVVGSRIVEVRVGGMPIDPTSTYSITCNNFMATGGDNFTVFVSGTNQIGGPIDLDALVEYVEAHTPLTPALDGRMLNP